MSGVQVTIYNDCESNVGLIMYRAAEPFLFIRITQDGQSVVMYTNSIIPIIVHGMTAIDYAYNVMSVSSILNAVCPNIHRDQKPLMHVMEIFENDVCEKTKVAMEKGQNLLLVQYDGDHMVGEVEKNGNEISTLINAFRKRGDYADIIRKDEIDDYLNNDLVKIIENNDAAKEIRDKVKENMEKWDDQIKKGFVQNTLH